MAALIQHTEMHRGTHIAVQKGEDKKVCESLFCPRKGLQSRLRGELICLSSADLLRFTGPERQGQAGCWRLQSGTLTAGNCRFLLKSCQPYL